jgi:hypothetical protein
MIATATPTPMPTFAANDNPFDFFNASLGE